LKQVDSKQKTITDPITSTNDKDVISYLIWAIH
jgi:hypothetical protein